MTDREKLVEILEAVEGQYNNDFPTLEQIADGLIAGGVTFAADNNVGSKFGKDINVPDKNVGKWIPVTERLPEIECYIYSVNVLFHVPDGNIYVGYVNYETGTWKCLHSRELFAEGKVTHWMPLPEAPKEDNHEDNT